MLKLIYSAVIAVSLIAIPMSGKAQESKAKSETSKSAPKAKGTTSQDTTTSKSTTTKKEPTAGQLAARERQKQCGVEWKEAKAAGKTKGTTWPKFWSVCNTRLKDKSG